MKAISFSLFGSDPRYSVGAMRNVALAKRLFPDWEVVIYTDDTAPKSVICELKCNPGVRIMMHGVDFQSKAVGHYWNLMAAGDERYDEVIFRHVDGRLLQRDVDAVNAWLSTDKKFHIIRDHPSHACPIVPGAFGLRPTEISRMIPTFLDQYAMREIPKADVVFLQTYLYPVAKPDATVHDPFFERKDFPSKRNGSEFIGQVFDEYDTPNKDLVDALVNVPNSVPWL